MKNIIDRFILIIESNIAKPTRFKTLENISEIPAVSWRKAFQRGQRPTVGMIEVISQKFPQYALWLATGITDSANGHIAIPEGYQINLNTQENIEQISCIRYLSKKTEILTKMQNENRSAITHSEAIEIQRTKTARNAEALYRLSNSQN